MNKLLALGVLLGASAMAAGPMPNVRIELIRYPEVPEHKPMASVLLSYDGKDFYCETDAVPRHRIRVAGLKSLESPLKSKGLSVCEQQVRWGKTKTCPMPKEMPLINQIIRWCTQI